MMTQSQSNSKQILKNALFLYLRMFISLIVSLYTTRIVLDVLGVVDYGIYSVVGGIVIMFSFLNVSMSSATSRFMAYEIGKNDQDKLNKVFSNAYAAHLIIAVIVLLLLETVGLWMLRNKLVIDESRRFAAEVVYHLSVLSTLIGFTQVPFNASIIAHEKFNVYAYVELINVFLKLVIVYFLTLGNADRLILYAILTFMVSLTIMMTYRIYCRRKFIECLQKPKIDKGVFKPMTVYAAWGVYGDGCYSLRQQGTNVLLNNFFGAVVNSANGVATTVLGAVSGFAMNIISAFRPPIIKSYAAGNFERMTFLLTTAIKYSLLMSGLMTIAIAFEMEWILDMWLVEVPQYTAWICRIILMTFCVTTCSFVIAAGIQASGNIRSQSFIGGSISLFGAIPCTYLLLKLGYSPYSAYLCFLAFSFIIFICNVLILKKQVKQIKVSHVITKGIFPILLVLLITSGAIMFLQNMLSEGLLRVCTVTIASVLICALLTYFIAMTADEKLSVKKYIERLFHR